MYRLKSTGISSLAAYIIHSFTDHISQTSISCLCTIAAEQKARTTYDNILRLVKDPEVCDPIRFLREREIVHFQRFGEGLNIVKDHLDCKNFYAFNQEFDIRKR